MTFAHFQNQCKQLLVISITFLSISLLCQPAWSHNKNNTIKYAPNPPYDNIPITPKTWEQVDLTYYSTISGHQYTNSIQLLRPIALLHKRHMDTIGSKVTLSMPEFSIVNVMATVKAIKPTRVDSRGFEWSKRNREYVIGKFIHYVTDVRTYTFKDGFGHISHINSTPNHPFYVKNKHGFVAIGNASDEDTLVGDIGSGDNHIDDSVHLVCAKGIHSHCGVAFWGGDLPASVYNLEVYRWHVYRVGGGGVLIHNGCEEYSNLNDDLIRYVLDRKGELYLDDIYRKGGCGSFVCLMASGLKLNQHITVDKKPWAMTLNQVKNHLDIPIEYPNELTFKLGRGVRYKHISNSISNKLRKEGIRLLSLDFWGSAHVAIVANKRGDFYYFDNTLFTSIDDTMHSNGWSSFDHQMENYAADGASLFISHPISTIAAKELFSII